MKRIIGLSVLFTLAILVFGATSAQAAETYFTIKEGSIYYYTPELTRRNNIISDNNRFITDCRRVIVTGFRFFGADQEVLGFMGCQGSAIVLPDAPEGTVKTVVHIWSSNGFQLGWTDAANFILVAPSVATIAPTAVESPVAIVPPLAKLDETTLQPAPVADSLVEQASQPVTAADPVSVKLPEGAVVDAPVSAPNPVALPAFFIVTLLVLLADLIIKGLRSENSIFTAKVTAIRPNFSFSRLRSAIACGIGMNLVREPPRFVAAFLLLMICNLPRGMIYYCKKEIGTRRYANHQVSQKANASGH
ncbi:hypothetical protein FWC63_02770 [Candidatus Saccharibacteria bacterium]|nr:hypothetical protein [Candidatus Saccharibacteria bacterium]